MGTQKINVIGKEGAFLEFGENVENLKKRGIGISMPIDEKVLVRDFDLRSGEERPVESIMSIEGVVRIASIIRIPVESELIREAYAVTDEEEVYADILRVFPDVYRPIGLGIKRKDEDTNELEYIESLSPDYSESKMSDIIVNKGNVSTEWLANQIDAFLSDDELPQKFKGLKTFLTDVYEKISVHGHTYLLKKGYTEKIRKKIEEYTKKDDGRVLRVLFKLKNEWIFQETLADYINKQFKKGNYEELLANAVFIGVDENANVNIVYGLNRFDIKSSVEIENMLKKYPELKIIFRARAFVGKSTKYVLSFASIREHDENLAKEIKDRQIENLETLIELASPYPELSILLSKLKEGVEKEDKKVVKEALKGIENLKNDRIRTILFFGGINDNFLLELQGDAVVLTGKDKGFGLVKMSDLYSTNKEDGRSYRAVATITTVPFKNEDGNLQFKTILGAIRLKDGTIIENKDYKQFFRTVYDEFKDLVKKEKEGHTLTEEEEEIKSRGKEFLRTHRYGGVFYPDLNEDVYSKYSEFLSELKDNGKKIKMTKLLYNDELKSEFEKRYGMEFNYIDASKSIARLITERKLFRALYLFNYERFNMYNSINEGILPETGIVYAMQNAISISGEFKRNIELKGYRDKIFLIRTEIPDIVSGLFVGNTIPSPNDSSTDRENIENEGKVIQVAEGYKELDVSDIGIGFSEIDDIESLERIIFGETLEDAYVNLMSKLGEKRNRT